MEKEITSAQSQGNVGEWKDIEADKLYTLFKVTMVDKDGAFRVVRDYEIEEGKQQSPKLDTSDTMILTICHDDYIDVYAPEILKKKILKRLNDAEKHHELQPYILKLLPGKIISNECCTMFTTPSD